MKDLKVNWSKSQLCLSITVNKVLSKYSVDLSLIKVSTQSRLIFISGIMLKKSGHDLPAHEVMQIVEELSLFASIRTDLKNWTILDDEISYCYETSEKNFNQLKDVA